MRDKHVGVEFQMSLKPMVWNRIISMGKVFDAIINSRHRFRKVDAMYTFVIVTMR